MAKRLHDNLNTDYLGAAQRLRSQHRKRRIVAYVEGYDDVFFWRAVLDEVETEDYTFQVMLPSRSTLGKGKKVALMNALRRGVGPNLIVCVDADYDYLMQGANENSRMIVDNPYVFHTYAYAIENFQCYAPSLHTVCVMATLNDHDIFPFEDFMTAYSQIVFPLLVWSVWAYRYGFGKSFTLQDLALVVKMGDVNLQSPNQSLQALRRRVNSKVGWLQNHFPQARAHLKDVEQAMRSLGVTPQNAYLYMRGHDVYDKVVYPLVTAVCRQLVGEREREIRRLATHSTQRANELSGYSHSTASVDEMLKKQTHYKHSPLYRRIIRDVQDAYDRLSAARAAQGEAVPSPAQDAPAPEAHDTVNQQPNITA